VVVAINRDSKSATKELIVGYKQNHQNSHNLVIMDMGIQQNVIYKHESYALWE